MFSIYYFRNIWKYMATQHWYTRCHTSLDKTCIYWNIHCFTIKPIKRPTTFHINIPAGEARCKLNTRYSWNTKNGSVTLHRLHSNGPVQQLIGRRRLEASSAIQSIMWMTVTPARPDALWLSEVKTKWGQSVLPLLTKLHLSATRGMSATPCRGGATKLKTNLHIFNKKWIKFKMLIKTIFSCTIF